jgi:monofunctional glycosyltransferase
MKNAVMRWLALLCVATLALQLFFIARIAVTASVDPTSTTFERSQAWQLTHSQPDGLRWRQQWVPYERLSDHLKRAVIASEDGSFATHGGVDWKALETARQRNAKAEARAEARSTTAKGTPAPKIVGGSTITQQLAKNLLLSGERNLVRKGQELVLTLLLEALLDKRRILEIYLNHVEWGEGVFGAEAAAQHYFRKSADRLTPAEAARLVVMLPRPRYFERLPNSSYLSSRAQLVMARMNDAVLPR